MADDEFLSPEEKTLITDLTAPEFKLGVARGHWELVGRDRLILQIKLSAPDRRWFGIRCDCQGYAAFPPFSAAWSINNDCRASATERPNGSGELAKIFRMDWEDGDHLYHPMSRRALETHADWKTNMPHRMWQPETGIVQLLIDLHDRLFSKDYQPTPCTTV